ncbi:hypothetical protein dsx2_2314 [Desulfovibrio sp. X2]|uniref:hypothetical protein n=1 Tax=Desulfovibrio sp. X2 TaxID=941449 RepID=UPI000358ACE1|nr:hypothetical protein [Desulfovibrio sp. X2]EPR43463.1 hypothetical protein dsx2_2314 [Desulfovibrio sp. X2]
MSKPNASALSTWIYRLLVLALWAPLGWFVLSHLPSGNEDGTAGAALILGFITFGIARFTVRVLWMVLGLLPPEELI